MVTKGQPATVYTLATLRTILNPTLHCASTKAGTKHFRQRRSWNVKVEQMIRNYIVYNSAPECLLIRKCTCNCSEGSTKNLKANFHPSRSVWSSSKTRILTSGWTTALIHLGNPVLHYTCTCTECKMHVHTVLKTRTSLSI